METHKIDQLFKQKLDRHSETVSADAFAKVQAQMKGKKQKKGFPWMIAASVSILLVFSLVYNFTRSEEPSLAKIELNNAQLSFSGNDRIAKPEIDKVEQIQETIPTKKNIISKPAQQPSTVEIVEEDYSRMASIEKVSGFDPNFNMELIPELRLSPQKHENKVIVEIHYAYAETKKEENLIVKSNNKLKSLASEFSLAELRSAKNELFASALQFNKKENN